METLFTGKSRIFLPFVDSTNSYAMQLLKNVNPPEGTVVYTHEQRQGRGQRENVWITPPGRHLTASIIYRPNFLKPDWLHYLMMVAAVAAHDTLSDYLQNGQYDIKVKWPNDILVNERKIAGILIENNLTPGRIQWSVLGFGINVNELEMPLPNATSLQQLTGTTHALNEVMDRLCVQLEKHYLLLRAGKHEQLREAYLSRFYGLHQRRVFYKAGVAFVYTVEGISEEGHLVLLTDRGERVLAGIKDYAWGDPVVWAVVLKKYSANGCYGRNVFCPVSSMFRAFLRSETPIFVKTGCIGGAQ